MPHLNEHFDGWIDRTLTDGSGHKIGTIVDIYTDDETGQPEWLAVATTGLLGSSLSFVPVHGATSSGGDVHVPFPKDQVKKAPDAGADGRLTRDEVARLYGHYGYDHDQERVRLQLWADAQTGPVPVVAPSSDRGRWPDDEQVFDLRQETGYPEHRVEVGSEPRRR